MVQHQCILSLNKCIEMNQTRSACIFPNWPRGVAKWFFWEGAPHSQIPDVKSAIHESQLEVGNGKGK